MVRKRLWNDFAERIFNVCIRQNRVGGVQQLFGLVACGFAKELGIELLDIRVVVGTAPEAGLIVAIETSGALGAQFVGGAVRLSAAADATAGAGHHFDKVIGRLFARCLGRANFLNHLFDVGQSVRHGDANGLAGDLDGAFLDALQAARHLELNLRCVLAGDEVVQPCAAPLPSRRRWRRRWCPRRCMRPECNRAARREC